jgi:hypothetical protein
MTDLTTIAPVIVHRPAISVKLPIPGIGRAFNRMLEAFGHAVDLAYVQPYCSGRSKSTVVLEGSEKGRDPNW